MKIIERSVMAASTSTFAGTAGACTSRAYQDDASTSCAGCSSTLIILDDNDSEDNFHWSDSSE